MRAGILIVGSLLWENTPTRESWRRSRLIFDNAEHVDAPIRYGRRSQSRGNTFTMTFASDGPLGRAVMVPCLTTLADPSALVTEAEELWQAEQPGAKRGSIGASWGCVGVLFRENPPPTDWAQAWTNHFRRHPTAIPLVDIDSSGSLRIPCPSTTAVVDVILATATRADVTRPRPQEVADAWIGQNQGHERYFFENVKHGIRTPEDHLIWKRIEEATPDWLSGGMYVEAVAILRAESKSNV